MRRYHGGYLLTDKDVPFYCLQEICESRGYNSNFFQEIFKLHRMSRIIVSDRDKNFTSTARTIFTQRAGIKLQMTTSHNPQVDEKVERINQILAEMITSVLDSRGSE